MELAKKEFGSKIELLCFFFENLLKENKIETKVKKIDGNYFKVNFNCSAKDYCVSILQILEAFNIIITSGNIKQNIYLSSNLFCNQVRNTFIIGEPKEISKYFNNYQFFEKLVISRILKKNKILAENNKYSLYFSDRVILGLICQFLDQKSLFSFQMINYETKQICEYNQFWFNLYNLVFPKTGFQENSVDWKKSLCTKNIRKN